MELKQRSNLDKYYGEKSRSINPCSRLFVGTSIPSCRGVNEGRLMRECPFVLGTEWVGLAVIGIVRACGGEGRSLTVPQASTADPCSLGLAVVSRSPAQVLPTLILGFISNCCLHFSRSDRCCNTVGCSRWKVSRQPLFYGMVPEKLSQIPSSGCKEDPTPITTLTLDMTK